MKTTPGSSLGFGLAFAIGGIVTGLIADRISPRWLYPVVLAGLVGRRVRDRLGDAVTVSCSSAGCCWGFSRPDSGPVH